MADTFRMAAKTLTANTTISLVALGTASTAIVRGVTFCNTHASASATYDFTVVPNGLTASIYLVKGVSLAAQATSQPLTNPIVLNAGDTLQAKASVANQIDCTVSYLESY